MLEDGINANLKKLSEHIERLCLVSFAYLRTHNGFSYNQENVHLRGYKGLIRHIDPVSRQEFHRSSKVNGSRVSRNNLQILARREDVPHQ